MKKIGIIGAGVMGQGVAQVFARKDYDVRLIDVRDDLLDQAKKAIHYNMRMQALFDRNKEEAYDIDTALSNIIFTTDMDVLKDVEIVIENVTEKLEVKKQVYELLQKVCKKDCILAVNTSCIPIAEICRMVDHPERVIGTHFMNPAYAINAIEVIRGTLTSEDTMGKMTNELNSIGKECIVVNDSPGFVSNRISHLLMNEAALLVEEHVAAPEDIDSIFKKCYGHKMGPLETADLIGIDTVVNSLEILHQNIPDSKFNCSELLLKMVEEGHLGRKTKQGFYTYTNMN